MAIKAKSESIINGTVTNSFQFEEMVEEIRNFLNNSMEYADEGATLQARQSFGEAKACMEELERHLETLPTTGEAE